jgi:N-acetylmuramic acid 6-phosphate etherase
MTGGDRALISALGRLRRPGAGGRTAAQRQRCGNGGLRLCHDRRRRDFIRHRSPKGSAGSIWENWRPQIAGEAAAFLYFIYNNPDEALMPLERSRSVIVNPAITKINLTTGPQAITGSTRMQAATSETFVLGIILDAGIFQIPEEISLRRRVGQISASAGTLNIKERLLYFEDTRKNPDRASSPVSQNSLLLNPRSIERKRRATYFAKKALITVFIDCAERSPTFHLSPLGHGRGT